MAFKDLHKLKKIVEIQREFTDTEATTQGDEGGEDFLDGKKSEKRTGVRPRGTEESEVLLHSQQILPPVKDKNGTDRALV